MRLKLGRSLNGLNAEEKLIHYRLSAEDAMEKAGAAKTAEMSAGFLTMAAGWHELAAELERHLRRARHASLPGVDDPVAVSDEISGPAA